MEHKHVSRQGWSIIIYLIGEYFVAGRAQEKGSLSAGRCMDTSIARSRERVAIGRLYHFKSFHDPKTETREFDGGACELT